LWWFPIALTLVVAAGLGLFGTAAWLLWLTLDRPAGGGLAVADQLDLVRIALIVTGGLGGVVALLVAYRKQRVAEDINRRAELEIGWAEQSNHRAVEAGRRDDTKLFNERFAAANTQLGHDAAAVRLGAVYAMASLADDWHAGRKTVIDVLCAYLRMPYQTDRQEPDWRQGEREVRLSIIRIIRDHLRMDLNDDPRSWRGQDFDFTGATFDGGDFTGAYFTGGTVRFDEATFSGGTVRFNLATFSGGEVTFCTAEFSGGIVSFDEATFSGSRVGFDWALFYGGTVGFRGATFSGGTVVFDQAMFSGGTARFNNSKFSGGRVSFDRANFFAGLVEFYGAKFSGGRVGFEQAEFSGGAVRFDGATFSGGRVGFGRAKFSAGRVGFARTTFSGSTVRFNLATFSGSEVGFNLATFLGGEVAFNLATFSGGRVGFDGATFSDGSRVGFVAPKFANGIVDLSQIDDHSALPTFPNWEVPPIGLKISRKPQTTE
jgi:uncharacterized protein YjbI with pentapeptide repeats